MTTPNGPDQPGARTGQPAPQPPYNPRPGVSRTVILGAVGAAVAVIVVVVLVLSLSGGGDENPSAGADGSQSSTSSTTAKPEFTPTLRNTAFTRSGWYDQQTKEPVAPPQRIRITGSIDLRADVESIGYGPIEQSMPKIAKYADTESSFPRNPPVSLVVDDEGAVRVFWMCETMYDKPAGADCNTNYYMTVDISGAEPEVVAKARVSEDYNDSSDYAREEDGNLSIANPEKLPPSSQDTDEKTGATTTMVLGAVQPNESRSKVFFLVPDSLSLYVGELESSR